MTTDFRQPLSTNGLKSFIANLTIYLKGKSLEDGSVDVRELKDFLDHMERTLMSEPDPALTDIEHGTFVDTREVFLDQLRKTESNWELLRPWYDSFQR